MKTLTAAVLKTSKIKSAYSLSNRSGSELRGIGDFYRPASMGWHGGETDPEPAQHAGVHQHQVLLGHQVQERRGNIQHRHG